ncbi:MAG: hypothetical protein P8N52_08560 [Crocinitomicaceae bacterium]|nr:hypothetical protein [Crocinitomicaceae bacterium]MDG1776791.1 hypothetical protein [Crocinitomicaceae bacterium]
MKLLFSFVISTLILSGFSSCTKTEGPGGAATIAGKIRKEKIIAGQSYYYDAVDEDVYLIYGSENTFYDDDIKTSFDGSFEFNYLEKGNYQFFVYSDCNSCLSGDTVLIQDVVISDKKERVDLGTITIQ